MMLVLSIVIGLIPLVGIAWTVENGMIATVDGLFMSIIMLALSGILFLNVVLEARKKFTLKKAPSAQKSS
jgi:ABC-type enterochelin transport system permease subunit